ncbi:zinc finger, CCHC-type containing protein [Tanacetum coccineum]
MGENSLLLRKAEGQTMSKQNSKAPGGRGRGWNGGRGSNGGREWNGGRGGRGSTQGGHGSGRGRGDRYGKKPSQEGDYSNRNPRDKSHIKCFECQEYGHYASECTNMKKPEQEVHLTREMEEQALLLCVKGENMPSIVMLNEDKVFPKLHEKLNESVTGQVWFGDGSTVKIKGKCTLLFQCKNGDQLMVSDVYFIPGLTSNIFSLGQLTKVGYDVWLHNDYRKVYNEQRTLVLKVQRSANRLYIIALKIAKPACLAASVVDDAWTWHARLGHANFYTLEFMGKKRMVTGMPCVSHPTQLCSGCVVAKQTRKSFPNEAQWRASKPLELLHADLCGLITPQSIGGNRYFLLIVDDWCRYMWVYFLRSKDEALAKFKIFKAQVEMETEHKVKALRTDRGGEFNSHAFVKFCQEEGIQRQTTAPYTPQQNGFAEAVRHAVYLLNSLPTKAVKDITPYEGWKKRKPNLEYLKIFGCLAFVKKVGGHLTKLEDRSIPMVYLGTNYMKGSGSANEILSSPFGGVPVNDTVPFDTFDDTPVRGTRLLEDIYQRAPRMTKEEIDSIEKNQTWTLTRLPPNQKVIGLKWVFKLKRDASDVKSAFLNGELKEEAPRSWNAKLDKVLKELGFRKCAQDQAVYKLQSKNITLIIGVYVDDIIVTGSSEKHIQEFKVRMNSIFKMGDMGKLNYYLGIEVKQEENGIIIKQESYARKILEEAGMSKCNPAKWPMDPKLQLTKDEGGKEVDPTKYRRIIGSLRYLINTRPDLSYSVGVVSKFMQSPRESHYATVKKILRYLKGTTGYGLKYRNGGNGKICGYNDSSHTSDIEDRRGTTCMMLYYSQNRVTWASHKQQTVALSLCEAEFMVATAAACQALWLRNMVSFLTGEEAQRVQLLIDNQSAIALMKNPVFHGRSKHIDTKYHFIRECVERDQVYVEHISGNLQKAYILTKALPRVKFAEMRRLIGTEDVNIKGDNVV